MVLMSEVFAALVVDADADAAETNKKYNVTVDQDDFKPKWLNFLLNFVKNTSTKYMKIFSCNTQKILKYESF